MTHAAKILGEELAYLRALHAEAHASPIIANSIASDIADLVNAIEVIAKLQAEREQGVAYSPQVA